MQLVDQDWPGKHVPMLPPEADQLEVQGVMLTPGSKLFYHVPCSRKLHDPHALLWLKSEMIKSLEDDRGLITS